MDSPISKQWGQIFESAIGAHIVSQAFVHRLFNPLATIIVGEKGIKPEVFLSMDLQKLFE